MGTHERCVCPRPAPQGIQTFIEDTYANPLILAFWRIFAPMHCAKAMEHRTKFTEIACGRCGKARTELLERFWECRCCGSMLLTEHYPAEDSIIPESRTVIRR